MKESMAPLREWCEVTGGTKPKGLFGLTLGSLNACRESESIGEEQFGEVSHLSSFLRGERFFFMVRFITIQANYICQFLHGWSNEILVRKRLYAIREIPISEADSFRSKLCCRSLKDLTEHHAGACPGMAAQVVLCFLEIFRDTLRHKVRSGDSFKTRINSGEFEFRLPRVTRRLCRREWFTPSKFKEVYDYSFLTRATRPECYPTCQGLIRALINLTLRNELKRRAFCGAVWAL